MLLTIVVTVLDEKDTIIEAIKQVEALDVEKEILVVDNHSTDGTRELLKKHQSDLTRVIFQDRNYGYGQSIITGCEMAQGDYLYVHNADLEYDPSYVYEMIECAQKEGCDAVFGSRLATRTQSLWTIIRERPYSID